MGESVKREKEIAALEKIADALTKEDAPGNVKSAMAEERAAQKKRLRAEALKRRDSLTVAQRKSYSDRIVKKLTSLPCYRNADALLIYVSFRSEVDTCSLLERAFAEGKAVFAPRVTGKEMDFYRIFSLDDLEAGYRGILEPTSGYLFAKWMNDRISQYKKGQRESTLQEGEIQEGGSEMPSVMICMPGAAFDRKRNRIGYGGGFYDRYLSRILGDGEKKGGTGQLQAEFTTAALAFECQIFETIPWEAHDICPERIITETEIV